MRLGVLLVGAALVGATWAKAERLPADPYGVCCHITRNWAGEWTDRDVLFREMKRAGISWIRADIDADSAMPFYLLGGEVSFAAGSASGSGSDILAE